MKAISKTLLAVVFITLLPTISFSAINSRRPRIWVDNAVLSRIQADATANTAEWRALKSWCDTNLAANKGGAYLYSGYHGLNWHKAVLSYGLAFLATGNQTYGNEGVVYLTALLRDKVDAGTVGDGLGGDMAIRTDSGYVTRSLGAGVAVGRDWLDGASNLSPAIINEATSRMAIWFNWIINNAHAISDPRDNYFYGHFAMFYTAGLSFYGDTGYDPTWLSTAEDKWAKEVLPLIDGGFYDGGDWSKGWNYAPWAARQLLEYLVARETATDETGLWDDFDWHEDIAKSQIHFLYPSRDYFSDNGMWSADIKGDPRSSLARFVASMTPVSATAKGWLRWYADNLTYQPNPPDEWNMFLHKISDIMPITPTEANVGGLAYTTNIGHFVARSAEWVNTDATLVEMFAYTDKPSAVSSGTNGDYNVGDMRIASRGKSLVADGDRQQYTAHYNNVLMVTGNHTYAPYQEPWLTSKNGNPSYPRVSMVTESGEGYHYAKAKNLQNAYDGTYWTNSPSLAHYDRSMLFLPPDTVIAYDNATATSASNDVSIRWWFPLLPAVSGNIVSTFDLAVDLKLTILGPAGHITTPRSSQSLTSVTGTTTYREGYYFIDFVTSGTPISNQIFSVFSISDHGRVMPTASLVSGIMEGSVNNCIGAKAILIDDVVALFTDDFEGGYIEEISYAVDATRHYITDLPPGTEVWALRSGEFIDGSPFLSSENGIISFVAEAGFANYYVSIFEPTGDTGPSLPDSTEPSHTDSPESSHTDSPESIPTDSPESIPTDSPESIPTDSPGSSPTESTGSSTILPPTIYVVPK